MTSSEVTRPRPTAPPVYRDGPSKMSEVDARSWSIDDVLDAVFFAIAAVATLWLAWLLIGSGWHLNAVLVVNSLLFWAVLAYLACRASIRSSPGSTSPTTSSAAPHP